MGCSFDSFSTSWSDRSYVIVLVVLAWFSPLLIICLSYISIILRYLNSLHNIKQQQHGRTSPCSSRGAITLGIASSISLDKNLEQISRFSTFRSVSINALTFHSDNIMHIMTVSKCIFDNNY